MNLVYENWNVRNICQYDFEGHSSSAIFAALRTHPYGILDGQLVENDYYESPLILANEPAMNNSDASDEVVARMLAHLRATS